jgi:hypothetical protein
MASLQICEWRSWVIRAVKPATSGLAPETDIIGARFEPRTDVFATQESWRSLRFSS